MAGIIIVKLIPPTASESEAIISMIAELSGEIYTVQIGPGNGMEIEDEWYETWSVKVLDSNMHIVTENEAPLLIDAMTAAFSSTPEREAAK
jgi:hypothetical protein